MAYAAGHPIRLVGGNLALDFLNTADWTAAGDVVHDKIAAPDDLRAWLAALGLQDATLPADLAEARALRGDLRALLQPNSASGGLQRRAPSPALLRAARTALDHPPGSLPPSPALGLIALAGLALLADPRQSARIRECPGQDCGWRFLQEDAAGPGRRRWCMMETCGNRAKAARHYARRRATARP